MIEFETELKAMVAEKNLMNSYKLYFLKAILMNASRDRTVFDFYEMACWMCAYAFKDACLARRRLRPLDKLYDAVVLSIEKEDLMESSSVAEVFDSVYHTQNMELRKLVASLCNYVPYRLLSYLWSIELRGKNDKQKNQIIEELSRGESRSVYSIYSIEKKRERIEMNSDWVGYITDNRNQLITWINKKIDTFVWRKQQHDIC